MDYPNFELSILVVNDLKITELNTTYLGRNKSTNVIAFPMFEGHKCGIDQYLMGDIVISIETANRESISANISLMQRFVELLIHGVLHLVGYDHTKSWDEYSRMNKIAKKLFLLIKEEHADDFI